MSDLQFDIIEKKLTANVDVAYILSCCRVLDSCKLKLTFVFENILKIQRDDISKLLSVDSTALEFLIDKKDKVLFKKVSVANIENFKYKDGELIELADLLFKILNKINYGTVAKKDFKKSFITNLIELLMLFTQSGTDYKHMVHAFIAYLYFDLSRQDTIFSSDGETVSLREQDRSKWDRELIHRGLEHLEKSAGGKNVSIYHLESAIAAMHCLAKSYKDTPWDGIVSVYDKYLSVNESAYVELQRAAILSKIKGPKEGIEIIGNIKNLSKIKDNPLLYSTLGNLHLQIHNYSTALENYEKAYEYSDIEVDRKFYNQKVMICRQRLKMIENYRFYNSF